MLITLKTLKSAFDWRDHLYIEYNSKLYILQKTLTIESPQDSLDKSKQKCFFTEDKIFIGSV